MLRRLLITLAVVSLFLPALAMADQIAQYTLANQGVSPYTVTDNGDGTETFSATNVAVNFSFSNLLSTPYGDSNPVVAYLTLSAITSTGAADLGGGDFRETGFSGTFSITGPGNLLSGVFGSFASLTVGSLNAFGDHGSNTEVLFTSDYVSFASSTNEQFAISLSDLPNQFGISSSGVLTGFTAAGTGTFSATPMPDSTPEPVTFLLAGGALLGLGMLRKRKSQPVL